MFSRVIMNTTINFVLFFCNLFDKLMFFTVIFTMLFTKSPAILFAFLVFTSFATSKRASAIFKIVRLFGVTHKKFMRNSKFSCQRCNCVGRIYLDVVT